MAFIAVIIRGENVVPIIKGGEGPDTDCLATWPTLVEAREAMDQHPMAQAFPVSILDIEDGDVW